MRQDGRKFDELRPFAITKDYIKYAEGSCLVEAGNTKVICTASVEDAVPPFLKGKGTGWITAEYGMIPRSCPARVPRESSKGKLGGRTHEIQRLVGRSLRAVCDMKVFGERTVWIDCDVIQADGGTRCAGITGSFVAMALAIDSLKKRGVVTAQNPIKNLVAAVSVGIINGEICLDLAYAEDSKAEVDFNVIMTDKGDFVEVQGTAEGNTFSRHEMNAMVDLAKNGIEKLIAKQREVLKGVV
jgi:ribonuclease PH